MNPTTNATTAASATRPIRRAVVTGGTGFLGSHLCTELRRREVEVVCLDNFLTGSAANIGHLVGDPGFRLVQCDVTDYVHVPGDVDLVLHFASPASPIDYLKLPIHTLKVGSIGTHHALGLAKDKGARFVLASTSEVYGDPQVHPQAESYWGHVNPVGPRGVYDEAKRFAEALTVAYRAEHGVDTAIVRIFNTFGPRMRPFDGRAIPTFIRQALAGEPLTVAGDGTQTRSVCYVSDLVRGILALADSGHSGPMNIGNPHELSVLQIAHDVIAATGTSSGVEFVERPVDDPMVRRPDTTLATEVLGWAPEVPWPVGLERTVEWFREGAGLPETAVRAR
ncbi:MULTISPECIES: NAD-dependent epimerase/dehydratase family protein [Kocuria]|uniref:NAD-dependent epimerase/dehydratase family protein n=1 Tax=Kocuria TaxID=57493 RepID=UPI00037AEA49|nr:MULTISPECIES: NAD-dependent epimerase/dehydratase family protein [Kocuria]EYT48163.1 epimerase [Kocuria sp. UCD-OTCP]MCM3485432.1 NAD-dependent epimerase/dehydratase family protein [Kocuria rosea]MEB2526234.1 NAD-dependent epimerase/dehydratase family protein [Kocuria rosea]MEB2616969.1 NAD-dependent epimerase/dehydratase family protein [Kocuria rosea]PWF80268.1 epimerase [Kocuria rosea]